MINYVWEVEVHWTFKDEYNIKQKCLHIIAPNVINACEKINKILIADCIRSNKIGGRSAMNLALIHSVKKLQEIDT